MSLARLEAEVLILRQQVYVLRRTAGRRPRLTAWDRLVFVALYRLCPQDLDAVAIVNPDTVIRWHRRGFKAFWRWKSRSRGGRPAIPKEIRASRSPNPPFAKYMVKRRGPPSQAWRTFLRNHADGIAATDLFVVPTIGFKLLYCLVFLAHGRREFVHHAVTAHPTAEWVARQMSEAFPWDTAPRYLVRDRDAVYGYVVKGRPRALGIRDRPTARRSPWQNAYVERLIGSVRRECLDHVIVLGETHLRRIVSMYACYCNEPARTCR